MITDLSQTLELLLWSYIISEVFYYNLFLLNLSPATESSLAVFLLSELKYKWYLSAVQGPTVQSSDIPVLTASLCAPQR